MRIGIAAAEAQRPCPEVVCVLTDGDTPWPDVAGPAKLGCVVIGNPNAEMLTPEFAVTVGVPSGAAVVA